MVARIRSDSRKPLVLLAVLSVASFAARIAWIGDPCHSPCRTAADHTLVFDETYYVNAARVIAGIRPPAGAGHYRSAPLGDDPNAEHPQLAKLVIAGAIELFGDGPFAWRIGSIILGSLAILGMYALVRAAGGGPWPALSASALMAADNLLLVHGRIGTLDIYAVTPMIWAAVLYLRGRPLLAGALVGVGACTKLVAPYVLLVFVVLELLRRVQPGARGGGRAVLSRLAICVSATAGTFIAVLAILDRIAPPYDIATGATVGGGVFGHVSHILTVTASLTMPHGATGIQSYPWQWLADYRPIVYLNINPSQPTPHLRDIYPPVHFLGMISPPILVAALVGLGLAARDVWRSRAHAVSREVASAGLPVLALSWTAGTLLPFELLSAASGRATYLYYMVIVMPGLYVAATFAFVRMRPSRRIVAGFAVLVLVALVLMYPLTPLPASVR
jgi:hypothetical protein